MSTGSYNMKTVMLASYQYNGIHEYPEDAFNIVSEINSERDFFNFLKDIYKRDCENYNEPCYGEIYYSKISFLTQNKVIICNESFCSNTKKLVDKPDYFEKVVKDFDLLLRRAKPLIRNIYYKKRLEATIESETQKLIELKKKLYDKSI